MGKPKIAARAAACADLFERFLPNDDGPEANTIDDELIISNKELWLEDQMDRFNTWAAYLGVFAFGHASIEHRLRDCSEIYSLVLQLLDALYVNLLYTIEAGSRPAESGGIGLEHEGCANEAGQALQARSDDHLVGDHLASSDSPTLSVTSFTFSSLSSSSHGSIRKRIATARSEVEDAISRLNRLSSSIRQSGSRYRDLKAESFVDWDEHGNDLTSGFANIATLVVNHKFPQADKVIRKRLAESIARRRNRFAYRRKHQQRLAKVHPEMRGPSTRHEAWKLPQMHVEPITHPARSQIELARKENVVSSNTSASLFDPESMRLLVKPIPSQASTDISASSTQTAALEYPPAPKVGKNDVFECPYCYLLCPAKEARRKYWRDHIMKDLAPFICVFPDCNKRQDLFRTFNDWITHMQSEHLPSKWECLAHIHGTEVFTNPRSYIEHMKLKHANIFVDSQLPGLAQMSARAESQIFTICPFCKVYSGDLAKDPDQQPSEAQDALQIHVAQHLKSLALMSLAWLDDVNNSVLSDTERFLSPKERDAPLTFVDPPVRETIAINDNVDTDWGGILPMVTDIGDDPAWTESLPEHRVSRYKEWVFCEKSLPFYDEHWKGDKLTPFVERWESGEEVLAAAAGSQLGGKETISLFLDRYGPEIPIIDDILKAAAGNEQNGIEILAFLLDYQRSGIRITEEVLMAAAGNEQNGKEVLTLLLNCQGSEVQITEEVLNTATRNRQNGKDLVMLLLNRRASNDTRYRFDLVVLALGIDPVIDIVAVHGLGGDLVKTWTTANGVNWLRDFVPKNLPGARIFSFGYPAEVFYSPSSVNLDSTGRSLLEGLNRERRGEEDQRRAIIFICHSMGGIVVKKALTTALIEDGLYGSIRTSVTGILFLSTPHRGSSETQFPIVLTSIAKLAVGGTSHFVGTMRTDLIRALDSQTLKDISTDFRNHTRNMKIASFIEQRLTPPAKARIVDDISGIMEIAGERIIPMHNSDHKSICRFSEETSEDYRSVLHVLQDWAEDLNRKKVEVTTSDDVSCLHSLAYPEMTYRRQEADRAYPNTCEWILQHPAYTTWKSKERDLLWIKGKPGSGKSTLMAFIYRAFQERPSSERSLNLSFFFHGQGVALQLTPTGMFRSLLHQLFTKIHSVRSSVRAAFKEKRAFGETGNDWEWQREELEVLFSNAVISTAKRQVMTIFVDAIDEAGFVVASELATYFRHLKDKLAIVGGTGRICISCRHYPIVRTSSNLEVWVDCENRGDISTYVQNELSSEIAKEVANSNTSDDWPALMEDIVSKSSGIFQLARLIVRIIVTHCQEGESLAYIRQTLTEVPETLGDVYEHILKNVIEPRKKSRTLHMMQWVCLATRPLSVTELRFAMASDDLYVRKSQQSCKDAKDFVETDRRMEKLITSLSGGLVEVQRHENGSTVQFIHQSVNDFLLASGLRYLALNLVSTSTSSWDKLTQDSEQSVSLSNEIVVGQSHDRLSRSCVNYLRLGEVLHANPTRRVDLQQGKLSFIDYATRSWLFHSERAENFGIWQEHLIEKFGSSSGQAFKNWTTIYRILDEYDAKCPEEDSTLLHVASSSNLASMVQVLLERGVQVEEIDDKGNRAIHYAARWGYTDLVKILLNADAKVGVKNEQGNTPLERAAANGHDELVRLLLDQGADINERTGRSGNALQAAALKGSVKVVFMLVEQGADVNAQGGNYGNALQAASCGGHNNIVHLLLEKGVDVNAQGGKFGNALQAASYTGYNDIVQLLLKKGADVNAQGGEFDTALQAASQTGHDSIVHLLLKNGADINAQGGEYDTALQAASYRGHNNIVQLLLEKGANVNVQGGEYGNALQAASDRGHNDNVQLLLENGADVNAQGGKYGNALLAASCRGHNNIVQQLLEKGADVNVQGGKYGTALQAASYGGRNDIVQLLLGNGANVNAQGGKYSNALQAASRTGHNGIIQLLLEKGANVNAQGGHFGNALQAASHKGYNSTVQLLLENGADTSTGSTHEKTNSHS